ncbi:MAG: efflux RND transporter permease subunit [Reyranella sp.]|nr:efflux RND transporter permease subunit [Reyranella sp.]
MMTTFATIGGGLPLAIGQGAGSELRRPLGIAIVVGLLVSQWLTLYTTPVIYLYLDRFAHWLSGKRRQPGRVPEVVPAAAGSPSQAALAPRTERTVSNRHEQEEYLEQEEGERERAGRRNSLIALLVLVVLVVAGLILADRLRSVSALQDCLTSRATNCAEAAPAATH